MSSAKETTLFEDLMAGFEEIKEFREGKRELRVTTLTRDTSDDWDAPYEPQFAAVIRQTPHGWVATVPDLPEVLAMGEDRDEAEANIAQEIQFYLATLRQSHVVAPAPTTYVRMMHVEQMSEAQWADEKAYREKERLASAQMTQENSLATIK